ncbi:L,D-transpeptidase [Actinokineospora bangkokensis]|uniref:L,D-transpeptidase n=1 Tax=Actinokineospora bangkokensis TaxID=1193682 RepID=A0A1Q9LFL4_9PSEU|nr:Ig-like domain-containing protein [Actinokineospora bangkokensis]OLR90813.1 L,D-transpeptidase [Actinokineospora bangkokensis]
MQRPKRWVPALLGAGVAAALALGGCSADGPVTAAGGAGVERAEQQAVATSAAVTTTPAAGAVDVAPGVPASVTVAGGSLVEVALTNPDGKRVAGNLAADKKSWVTTEDLGYGKTYTWSGTATGADGAAVPLAGAFTTAKPKRQVGASINTGDGQTYGVAMPIAVTFDAAVKDKVAAEQALEVETSVPTEGAWAWLDDRRAHWRPKEYWKPGTQVTVTVDIYGRDLGGGTYGRADLTSAFTIGRSQVVQANTQTHRMVVLRDGVPVMDFPASMGLDSDPGRVTRSGTHVVMSKHATYGMTNPKYDYENVVVPWAVRISNNGEFVHGYAPSIPQQGKRNVSHGCINLSPTNAKAYYDTALPGDPVEITGSTQQLGPADGDYYDWAIPWSQWTTMAATNN